MRRYLVWPPSAVKPAKWLLSPAAPPPIPAANRLNLRRSTLPYVCWIREISQDIVCGLKDLRGQEFRGNRLSILFFIFNFRSCRVFRVDGGADPGIPPPPPPKLPVKYYVPPPHHQRKNGGGGGGGHNIWLGVLHLKKRPPPPTPRPYIHDWQWCQ